MEQENTNTEVLTPEILREHSDETRKDPLRYTPSKRVFLKESHQKDVSSLKSNSKILKKKRPKDKLGLFKLNKHIWDPSMQLTQFGKSSKHLKKKDKLAADAQVSGSGVFCNKENNCPGKTDKNLSSYPVPLEYTFDILSMTTNVPILPLIKEPANTNKPIGNDFLPMTSPFKDVIHELKPDVTHKIIVGDLIDLGTPKVDSNYNVAHDSRGLSIFPTNHFDELVVCDLKSPLPCFNPLQIDSMGPSSVNTEAFVQTQIVSEPDRIGSSNSNCLHGKFEEQSPTSNALMMHDHNNYDSKHSDFEHNDQCEPASSRLSALSSPDNKQSKMVGLPLVFNGFPCLNPRTENIETKQTLGSHLPLQTLVDNLCKDPFPKSVRAQAKVVVRRRAFSMDEALMTDLDNRSLQDIEQSQCPLDVDTTAKETPCFPTSEFDGLSKKSNKPIEDMERSAMNAENGNVSSSPDGNRSSNCQESVSVPEDSKDTASDLNADTTVIIHGSSYSTSNLQEAEEKFPMPERELYPKVLYELSNVNNSNADSIGNIDGISLEPPSIAILGKNVSGKIENSGEAEDLGFPLALASGGISLTEESNVNCNDLLHDNADVGIEESENATLAALLLQGPKDSSITEQNSQPGAGQQISADKALVNGSNQMVIPSQSIFIPTPNFSSSDEKEFAESLASDVKESVLKTLSNLVIDAADDHADGKDENRHLPSIVENLITLPEMDHEISISSGYPQFSSTEESKTEELGKAMKPNENLVNISPAALQEVLGLAELEANNTAADNATPPKEIYSSIGVAYEDTDDDSIFGDQDCITPLEHWVLPPGKKYRRSLSIIRNLNEGPSPYARRGRHYEKSVEEIIRLQGNNVEAQTPVQTLRKRITIKRTSWMMQMTPPTRNRNTFVWSPSIPDRGTLYETPRTRRSIYSTPMHHNLVHRSSIRTSPMYGQRRSMHSPINADCASVSPVQYTIRDLILTICKQTEPCRFSDILNEESFEGGCKLGEGVFGEVFSINREEQNTVLKIIPIEGQRLVNGEKQKTYQEVLSELVIAKVLDELRYETDESNQTSGFAELIATSLVQGCYPETLLQFWEEFDQTKGSDNENPCIFDEEQLFIVMEQGNGGMDLESYTFSSAKQSLSIFKQIAFSLAVAEVSVEFEHRDLHWGNVLVSKTSEKGIVYILNGIQYSVATNGVKCTIIDYTLSRIKYNNQVPIYNDIGKDPEMFIATGDYQFDVYRFMKKDVEDDWSCFAPKTNARWLHYLMDKMLTKVKYQRKSAKVHKDSIKALEEISSWIEDSESALSIALRLAELKH